MMASRKLRDESSTEGRTIWKDVELAASRAPEWLKELAGVTLTPAKEEAPSVSEGDGGNRHPWICPHCKQEF